MSQQNVAIVRRIYASWAPGSSSAESNLLHPDIEWVNPSYALEPGPEPGIEAFAAITGELIRAPRYKVWCAWEMELGIGSPPASIAEPHADAEQTPGPPHVRPLDPRERPR